MSSIQKHLETSTIFEKLCHSAHVAIILSAEEGEFLLLFHDRKWDHYGYLGGTAENGETVKECLERELIEESRNTIKLEDLNILFVREKVNKERLPNVVIVARLELKQALNDTLVRLEKDFHAVEADYMGTEGDDMDGLTAVPIEQLRVDLVVNTRQYSKVPIDGRPSLPSADYDNPHYQHLRVKNLYWKPILFRSIFVESIRWILQQEELD